MHTGGERDVPAERATPSPVMVLGSAAEPWPVPGCACVACRSGTPASATSLRVGEVDLLEGRVTTPDGPVALRAGERYASGDVRIAALPGPSPDHPVLVVGLPGPSRALLWSAGSGDLPDGTLAALAGAGLDGVAIDVRAAGGRPEPRHLAHTLARLRTAGALAPGCDVIAIGLTHELAPEVLTRRLGWWGARIAVDGEPFPAAPPGRSPEPLRTLVLGPASSGKSAVAEDMLAAQPQVLYAATGPRPDAEQQAAGDGWADRVAAHRARRPAWWATDETGDLARLLEQTGPPLLVDALGTWLAAAMDRAGAWDDAPGWRSRVGGEVDALVAAWRQTRRRVVAVGEEVGWGVLPADGGIAAFRELLGGLARRLAGESEQVVLVVAGRVQELT
ncbi:MAG TPA: bifunctional adenosylcobinamide kinase/adenosylcobinamide-phosphate guanylyltransferase [Kineosporiaceae bacterium]|nr:bifunctional adenosylcobinamide kinase/adenosylcobinamide-phosphate guanylyltransferase [Kineosporiaceae bacterium]